MEVPRWLIWGAIILIVIWGINDPAGLGQFINKIGDSFVTIFKNIG